MKTRTVMAGTLAACVVLAAGAPVALAQSGNNSRTRTVEAMKNRQEEKRQAAPVSRPAPVKQERQSQPAARPAPQRESSRSTPAPSGRSNLYERAKQSAPTPTPQPRVEERRSEPTPARVTQPSRGTNSGGASTSNGNATSRQRVAEIAKTQRERNNLRIEAPATTPAPRGSTTGPSTPIVRSTPSAPGSSGSSRDVGRPIYRLAQERANQTNVPAAPNTGVGESRSEGRQAPAGGLRAPLTGTIRPIGEGKPDTQKLPHERMVERALAMRDDRVGGSPQTPRASGSGGSQERDGRDDRGGRDDRDGRDDRGGRDNDRDQDGRDWNDRRNDRDDGRGGWDGRHDRGRDWDRNGWNGRNRWDDCDDGWGRSGLSFGLSFGSGGWGLSASYGWSGSHYIRSSYSGWCDWRPRRYVYDPCDYRWDWCEPVVVRSSWHRPYVSSTCCWDSCHTAYHSAWCSKSLVTTYVPVYFTTQVAGYGTIGSVQTFTNDGYAGITSVPIASPLPVASSVPVVVVPSSVAVTYRANESTGVLDWSDTPSRIVAALNDSPESARGQVAGRYLGRSVAGAWELVVERVQANGTRTTLVCAARGASDRASPVVLLVLDAAPAGVREGSIVVASGRVVEVTLNDPDAPQGVLVMDEVRIAR